MEKSDCLMLSGCNEILTALFILLHLAHRANVSLRGRC